MSSREKVYAIWKWICQNIEYDYEGYKDTANCDCSPEAVLKKGKGICAGYAKLFKEMCSAIGVTTEYISGYAKGASYKLGDSFLGKTKNHAWNAVYLEEKWHLLDSCWGAGRKTDDFYFLTEPREFIKNHFPEDTKWQLLDKPVLLKDFQKVEKRNPYSQA
nr:PREDICTED: kyphoscoliosis peptidase-like [Latimeria chalumnae]|eukprot:XP_005989201.1 PREDICTED: kyphoscoliosis peptidase-like [Latimeria chalumnae]